jgi:putative sugar O-methyltransferase
MDLFSGSKELSDSQVTFYERSVNNIIAEDAKFQIFRRFYDYREILEHVDYNLGMKYLNKINELEPGILLDISKFKKNDEVGSPRKYTYPGIGEISPTTLRYISVAVELRKEFGQGSLGSVVEIGAGYGGQLSILSSLQYFSDYTIYDLPQVQSLIRKYLTFQSVQNVAFPEVVTSPTKKFDLVISNYAFSELPREVQIPYLEKILINSRRGYLIMNSGLENKSGRSKGKITVKEIQDRIPQIKIMAENPSTGPDNYVLVWSDSGQE